MRALRDLLVHIAVADDRPGDQLREHGDVKRQRKRIFLRPGLVAVHVDHITERLEGVKRDADRHDNAGQRERCAEQAVRGGNEKVQIFAHAEHCNVEDHAQRQPDFAVRAAHEQAEDKVNENGHQQQYDQPRLAVEIKEQAERQQHAVAHRQMPLRYDIVAKQHRGQEKEQENQTAEYHAAPRLMNG